MPSPGDTLLFAIAAQRQVTWSAFTEALAAVFVPDDRVGVELKHVRGAVAALGDSLGHWDIAPDAEGTRVCIAPPAIAILPWPGRPRAVLCGSRSPDTLPPLAAACKTYGVDLACVPQHQHPYAPTLVEMTADSTEALAGVARALHIECSRTPVAWALTVASGSVQNYISSRHWSPGTELNWLRRDFDPGQMRFIAANGAPRPDRLSLSAYVHPGGWTRQDLLWQSQQSSQVDRNWGRYAVLADRGIIVMRYDHIKGTVTIPKQLPLPKLAARSLALCSGRAPWLLAENGPGSLSYTGVPMPLFRVLATKLGQLIGTTVVRGVNAA